MIETTVTREEAPMRAFLEHARDAYFCLVLVGYIAAITAAYTYGLARWE